MDKLQFFSPVGLFFLVPDLALLPPLDTREHNLNVPAVVPPVPSLIFFLTLSAHVLSLQDELHPPVLPSQPTLSLFSKNIKDSAVSSC